MSELDLVVEDANLEFEALEGLVRFSTTAKSDGKALSPQARLVASDAAILFTAAAFEESVRQLGVAYARLLCGHGEIPDERLRAIRIGLWERASGQLHGRQFGTKRFDVAIAKASIAVLESFCLEVKDLELLVDHGVYNTRNLRADELNALFKRLGVSDICAKAGRTDKFKSFFSVASLNAAQSEFRKFLDKFYQDRNAATHDLGLFRAMGTVDVDRNIRFFKLAIASIASALASDLDGLRNQ